MARIIREGNFVTVPNNFIRNKEISFKAKGVFTYMASFDSSWNFTIKSMGTQSKDGYDSIKNAINELKKYGYITYEKHSDGTGTYTLIDDPKTENPNVDNPIKGKPTPIKKNNITKKNNTYKDFIYQLKKACKYKTKVTVTEIGEKLFKNIEDKGKLFRDYQRHQEKESNFSVRITAFMEDYKTVYSEKENEENIYGY